MSVYENGNFLNRQFTRNVSLFSTQSPIERDLSERYRVEGLGSLIVATGLADRDKKTVTIDFLPSGLGLKEGSEYWKQYINRVGWSQVSICCQVDSNLDNEILYHVVGWEKDTSLLYFELLERDGALNEGYFRLSSEPRHKGQFSWDSRTVDLATASNWLMVRSSTNGHMVRQSRNDLRQLDTTHLMAQTFTSFCLSLLS